MSLWFDIFEGGLSIYWQLDWLHWSWWSIKNLQNIHYHFLRSTSSVTVVRCCRTTSDILTYPPNLLICTHNLVVFAHIFFQTLNAAPTQVERLRQPVTSKQPRYKKNVRSSRIQSVHVHVLVCSYVWHCVSIHIYNPDDCSFKSCPMHTNFSSLLYFELSLSRFLSCSHALSVSPLQVINSHGAVHFQRASTNGFSGQFLEIYHNDTATTTGFASNPFTTTAGDTQHAHIHIHKSIPLPLPLNPTHAHARKSERVRAYTHKLDFNVSPRRKHICAYLHWCMCAYAHKSPCSRIADYRSCKQVIHITSICTCICISKYKRKYKYRYDCTYRCERMYTLYIHLPPCSHSIILQELLTSTLRYDW